MAKEASAFTDEGRGQLAAQGGEGKPGRRAIRRPPPGAAGKEQTKSEAMRKRRPAHGCQIRDYDKAAQAASGNPQELGFGDS